MNKGTEVQHLTDSDELSRLREENLQLQDLITNLSVHERMFHSLFELSHDAILLLDGRRVFDCNGTAEQLFQTARDELLHTEISSLVKAEQYESFENRLAAAVEIEPQFFESHFVCSDQRRLQCEVSAAALMLYRRQFFMVNIRDITDRKETEHNLRVKSAQLQATINSFPFDFWINDTQNRTIMQNPNSRTLWGDQLGRHMEEVTDLESIKEKWRESNRQALSGKVVEREQEYIVEGQKRIYRNIVAPIWEEEQVIGILGLNIDITDYKTTQKQLSTALEERETLLREIHHRVKNNLQLIISLLNLQKPSIDTEKLDVVTNIENRINSMALIHDQLYDSYSLSRINMPDYFEQLANTICESFDLAQRTISIDVSVINIDLPIDTALPLGIIVNELISNSLKHAFSNIEHGEIRVLLSHDPEEYQYTLRVKDNGRGCEASEFSSGSGLGITLVEQLAIQIGGTVAFKTRDKEKDQNGFSAVLQIPIGEK
ncbi:MAG: sensor histidine kinase [Spirochaetota bacterium]